jgi:ankyrin repeat protein
MLLWSSNVTLTIDGFNDAIVVRPDRTPAFDKADRLFDLSSIVSICSGLVLLMRIGDTDFLSLCFAHSSVKDFLLSPDVPLPFKSQLEERTARVSILRTCFAYLSCLDWDFDDKLDFIHEYQFAISANDIWPRQARALEATDDEVLALTIDFLESDLQHSKPFFYFTYPKVAPGAHDRCALYIAATEGLVRSCRHLIQHELASAQLKHSAPEPGAGSKSPHQLVMIELACLMKDIVIANAAPRLQFRLDNALVTACFNGHDDIVRDLLHHGASANAIDECNIHTPPGGSALLAAAEYGHLEIAKMLIEEGASINHFVPEVFGTPLYAASKLGHLAVVKVLIEQKADPNIICGTCGSALLAAVQGDHADIVNALIACGADVNVVPWTPELPASLIGEGESVAWFNNPTLRFADQYGIGLNTVQAMTLFTEMTATGALVDMGADLESLVKAAIMRTAVSCGHGFSPLQSAAYSGRLDIVEASINAGAEINANGYHGTAFALAVQNGHEDIVDFLLERADVNLKRSVFLDGIDWSPLESAVARRQATTVTKILSHGASITDSVLALAANTPDNAEVVKLLIDAKANPDCRDIFGRTALQNAAVIGQESTVEMLLRHGACVDAPGPDADAMHFSKAGAIKHAMLVRGVDIDVQHDGLQYGTALQAAVYRGHRATVQILLAYGASISAPGPNGDALTLAAILDDLGMVDLLLVSNKSVFHTSDGSSALLNAAAKGRIEVVKRLLRCGIPTDTPGPDGTALHHAAGRGYEDVVLALLAGGADVDNDAECGSTPLRIAVAYKHTDTVRILLDNNADVNAVSDSGSTLCAAVDVGAEEIVNMLLSKGAHIDGHAGPKYLTPLQAAVSKGYERIVEVLLDAGADPNALDELKKSPSPLRLACQINREDIARLLLQRGADINEHDREFAMTPLQFCCSMSYESLIHTLVSFKADLDAPNPGGSALDHAVFGGNLPIATFLLEHGANPNIHNAEGTLLQDAAYRGNVAMVAVLLDHGAEIDHSCGETCPSWGACALYQAVALHREDVVKLLLSKGASLEVGIAVAERFGVQEDIDKMLALRPVS